MESSPSLVRSWRRQTLRASGAALVAPLAVAGVLATLVLSGGFGRLGSFGEVFSGPALSFGPSQAAARSPLARALASVGAAAAGPVVAVRPARLHGGGPGAVAPAGTASGSGAGGRSGGRGASGGVGGGRPAAGGSGGSGSGGSGSGGGGPGGVPGTVKRVIASVATAATTVTEKVPGPLGPTLTQAVQSAASTVSGLIPGHGTLPGPLKP